MTLAFAGLVLPTSAGARSQYCSPSGDFCQAAFKEGGDIILELRTFSFRGVLDVCVAKQTNVCRESRLRKSKKGVYVSRVSWKRRYPDQGKGTYRVRWLLDGTKIGKTITFKR